jgi:hypothetical protein
MKDEMENQQTRKMKRENPPIEIYPGSTRRTVANGKTMYQMIAALAAGSRMPEHRQFAAVVRALSQKSEIRCRRSDGGVV